MFEISLHSVWLVYVSCHLLAAGLSAAGDSVTYPYPGPTPQSPVLRLDEASIEDLAALQASGLVDSVDLVHACAFFVLAYALSRTKC